MYTNLDQCVTQNQSLDGKIIENILLNYAQALRSSKDDIIEQNLKDLAKMDKENPKYDRLLLNSERIESMCNDVEKLAKHNFCTFTELENYEHQGLHIVKQRVPMGVVGIIYESRPNVTVDAISICLKTQNICLLKGSAEADFSNKILVDIAKSVLEKVNINPGCVRLLKSDRNAALELIQARGMVDVCIARGSHKLIEWVRDNAKVPFIETGAGVVHIFIDQSADLDIARNIILNSKTRRPSVCNSLDCVVVSEKILDKLPYIFVPLLDVGVEIRADRKSHLALKDCSNPDLVKMASEEDFSTEFLSLKLAVKTVKDAQEAIFHIKNHSGKHSEAIITNNPKTAEEFIQNIDAAAVYWNTATSFTDGGCFGMLSEIGISTQKLHARGPFSLAALTSYKWVVKSDGLVR